MDQTLQDLNDACEQARREINADPNSPFVAGCVLLSKTLQACMVAMLASGGDDEGDEEEPEEKTPTTKSHKAA